MARERCLARWRREASRVGRWRGRMQSALGSTAAACRRRALLWAVRTLHAHAATLVLATRSAQRVAAALALHALTH
eukprot:2396341-Prymnesium_polylepis.1